MKTLGSEATDKVGLATVVSKALPDPSWAGQGDLGIFGTHQVANAPCPWALISDSTPVNHRKRNTSWVTTNHVICETILHLVPTLKNYTTYFRFGESQRSLSNFSHSFIPQVFHSNHLAVSSSYRNNCLKARTLQKASVEENLPGASRKISQRKTAEAIKNGRDKPRPWMESRRHEWWIRHSYSTPGQERTFLLPRSPYEAARYKPPQVEVN